MFYFGQRTVFSFNTRRTIIYCLLSFIQHALGSKAYKNRLWTHISGGVGIKKNARPQQAGTKVFPTACDDLKYISIYLVGIIELCN